MALFTCTEAASAAGMSFPTFQRRVRAGLGPKRFRHGRAFFVTKEDLETWIASLS